MQATRQTLSFAMLPLLAAEHGNAVPSREQIYLSNPASLVEHGEQYSVTAGHGWTVSRYLDKTEIGFTAENLHYYLIS